MEFASSFKLSSSNVFRGCCAFGRIRSMSISRSCSVSRSGVPNRALNPRPNAFRGVAMDNLLRKSDVAFRTFRFDVVQDNRPAVAWRFAQTDISRNNGGEQLAAEERLEVLHDLV